MLIDTDTGLRFEASIHGSEEFAISYTESCGRAFVKAESAADIILNIGCFKLDEVTDSPEILLELYIDGTLRNVTKPRTGRGLAEKQIAEAKIDRGVVLNTEGAPILKKFHFVDLDLDDAILNSRIVRDAGRVEVRIIQAGAVFNEEDDISFDLPSYFNDRGAVSLFCGELNNTVGIRFEDGNESLRDTKEIHLKSSVEYMAIRAQQMLGETLAIFSFDYASDEILHHLGAIPVDHKFFNVEMAGERSEVRARLDKNASQLSIDRAVEQSDYTLVANIGEPNCVLEILPRKYVANSDQKAEQRRKRSPLGTNSPSKIHKTIRSPQKLRGYLPLTPPATPEERRRQDFL